jgi:hypothetical protein
MATPRTTRLLLIVLCLFAFGPIMIAALFKIVGIETRNGYRSLKSLVQTRAHPGNPLQRGSSDPDDRTTTIPGQTRRYEAAADAGSAFND